MKLVEEIKVVAHETGKLEFLSKGDIWVGFNFEFPEGNIAEYQDRDIFEIKDVNGFAGISTGAVDNSASTVFSAKNGKVVVPYKNKTNLSYRVIFWIRAIN